MALSRVSRRSATRFVNARAHRPGASLRPVAAGRAGTPSAANLATIACYPDGFESRCRMSPVQVPGKPFTREEFVCAERTLLSQGRWPKATVWKVRICGGEWIVKDFSARSFLTRNLIGALLVRREGSALARLDGLPGIPPGGFVIDRFALAYRFTPGRPLSTIPGREQPPSLFPALERTLQSMHARNILHLDVRNRRNVLLADSGDVLLIDFESHLDTRRWPAGLRRAMERFDLGGAYKHWANASPDTLGDERRALMERSTRWRKLWVFRGFWFYPREARKLINRMLGRRKTRPGGERS